MEKYIHLYGIKEQNFIGLDEYLKYWSESKKKLYKLLKIEGKTVEEQKAAADDLIDKSIDLLEEDKIDIDAKKEKADSLQDIEMLEERKSFKLFRKKINKK